MPILVDDVELDETATVARFTLRLSAPSALPVSVSYNNSSFTASNGADYSARSGTVTFAPGQTQLTIDIPLLGDSIAEPTEYLTLNLFSAVNDTIAREFAWATIRDNDQPRTGTPVVRVADRVVDESAGVVNFTVTLDHPSNSNVSVNVATANGTAVAGSDYTALSQTLVFTPGQVSKTVSVALLNDALAEAAEWFDLRLSAPSNATLLAPTYGRATIGANDAAAVSQPLISVSDAVADESDEALYFVVSLSAPSNQQVRVSYNNSSISAANGSDYRAVSGTLVFLPGETTKVVMVPLRDDLGAERTELVGLNLFSAVNAAVQTEQGLGSIYDNDAAAGTPVVRVADTVVDESAGSVTFTVALDRPATGNVSVNVATADGTAIAGQDYTALPAQALVFTPGETVKTVSVALANDTVAELDESFELRLSGAAGATLLPNGNGRATIGANDAAAVSLPYVSVSDAVAGESDDLLRFVVSLSAPSTQQVRVSYNNSSITAAHGSDYLAQSGTLVFAPGETTKVVVIPVLDDLNAERTELIGLNLFSPVGATVKTEQGLGSIHDNDAASGTPVMRVADSVVDESAGSVTFTIALDRPATGNVSVNVATANGTAVAGQDYTALPAQTLVFRPGETVKTVSVALANDTVAELAEYFDLRLSGAVGATLPAPTFGRATIGANDAAPVSLPYVTAMGAVADESDGMLRFVVSLSAPSTQQVSVAYNNSSITAAHGSDYLAQSGTLLFAPGETTKVVVIPVLDDLNPEATELLGLNLFSPVNARVLDDQVLGILHDNDATTGTPVIRVADSVVDEAAGVVHVTIALDRPGTGNVAVSVATANGSAVAGSDYVAQPLQQLVFTPGQTVKTVDVALVNDAAAEPGEYFDVVLSAPSGASLPDTSARVYIAPSDAPAAALPLISVSDVQAGEADTALRFLVSLSAPSAQQVSVAYNNSSITAAHGSDYLAQSGTLVFAPGQTVKEVVIPLLNDLNTEAAELIGLNLFSAVNGRVVDEQAIGRIHDNDATSGVPVLSVSDGIVDESGLFARFEVMLDRPSTSQVRVQAATAGGTAVAGQDFEALPAQTLVFAPGETSRTVLVNLRNDAVAEGPEFFDLQLSGAVNASIGDVRGHVAIAPSDAALAAMPTVSAVAVPSSEGGTALDFVVTLSAPSAQLVSVAYNNSSITAAHGSDYLAQSGTLVFAPGETLQVLHFPVLDDLATEATETFNLNLFSPTNATVGTATVAGSIIDNDPAPAGQLSVNGTGNAEVLVGRPGANVVVGGGGDDLLDGVAGVAMRGGAGNDTYIVETATDSVSETGGSGTDTVAAYVSYTLGAGLENLLLLGGAAINGTGNTGNNGLTGTAAANVLDGQSGNDVLKGGAGNDTLTGGAGADDFVFDNLAGSDTLADWSSADDRLVFSMAGVRVGDGDTAVEGALLRAAPGGFGTAAELVVFSADIAGGITAASAAAAIGSAGTAYAVGNTRLFAVDNGTDSGVFLFRAADADAQVEAAELTLLATAKGGATALSDYAFVA